MSLRSKIKKRRASLSPEKKARRKSILKGISSVAKVIPFVGDAVEVTETAVKAGKDIRAGGGANFRNIANASVETINKAVEITVADDNEPDFDSKVGDAITNPLTILIVEASNEIIDRIEAKIGFDIPDGLEEEILEAIVDVIEDVIGEAESRVMDIADDLKDRAFGWIKNLLN